MQTQGVAMMTRGRGHADAGRGHTDGRGRADAGGGDTPTWGWAGKEPGLACRVAAPGAGSDGVSRAWHSV